MGGNALALAVVNGNPEPVGVQSKRLHKKDFDSLTAKVVKVLNAAIEKANSMGANIVDAPHEVKAYRQKETFGDLDLLVDGELFSFVPYEEVMEMLRVEFNHTGPLPYKPKDKKDMVMSIGLPSDEEAVYFQLDLIASERAYYNFQSSYLNWNDLGNLVGVVASSNGFLKYGHDGLRYLFRDGDNLFESVVLTNDWDEALEFFGYSQERYYAGFDNLLEIYEYAASSRYFSPSLYAFENRNHTQRTRDRKRPTYNGFLNWIEEQDALGYFKEKTPMDSDKWKERVYEFFPSFAQTEKDTWAMLERRKVFKEYFNGGRLLKFKPELKNKEISDYLKALEQSVPDIEEFVVTYKDVAMEMLVKMKEA
jgi:hypothetical protein